MSSDNDTRSTVGVIVFVACCGLPALIMNGFLMEVNITIPIAAGISFVGGAIGGVIICRRSWLAGLIGGAIAGPLGLFGVLFYTSFREEVWSLELVIIQMLASLPGVGIGKLIMMMQGIKGDEDDGESEFIEE